MKFIIGIGNPGKEYSHTRHNIGFQVVDYISSHSRYKNDTYTVLNLEKSSELKAHIAFLTNNIGLAKPDLYVNNTGGTISAITNKYGINNSDFLIVCDDVNLPFGKLRLRQSGSSGGHKGLESVIQDRGLEDFPRLRIGVGNDTMPKDLSTFVLEKFSNEEMKQLTDIVGKAALISETWAVDGFEAAMAVLNK